MDRPKYIKDNFWPGIMPMEFISMDLVGRFSRKTSGHEYASQSFACSWVMPSESPLNQRVQKKLWTSTWPMLFSHLQTAEKSCLTMRLCSRTVYLRKLPSYLVWNIISIHWYTDLRQMDRWRFPQVTEGVHHWTHSRLPRMGWCSTTCSYSLQLVPKWTFKGSLFLSHVWARCNEKLHQNHQTLEEIYEWYQRTVKMEQLHCLYKITAYNLLNTREYYMKDQLHRQLPQPHLKLGYAVLVWDQAQEQFRPRFKNHRIKKRLGNIQIEVSKIIANCQQDTSQMWSRFTHWMCSTAHPWL